MVSKAAVPDRALDTWLAEHLGGLHPRRATSLHRAVAESAKAALEATA